MNKQELIDILENLECSTESLSYDNGYEQGVYDSLSHVILLDEPKKVILPKIATDFIEESLGIGSDKVDIISSADSFSQEIPDDEFSLWFKSNRDLFVDALANGYEVEKEPLYYVKLPVIGYLNNPDGGIKHTEQEIKAIDERYWLFKEEVKEGE